MIHPEVKIPMASEFDIFATIALVMTLESVLIWFIYNMNMPESGKLVLEQKKGIFRANTIRIWFSRNITNRRRSIILFSGLYLFVALVFWGILIAILQEESLEIIRLTVFLLPTCFIWGIIDGYQRFSKTSVTEDISPDKMRLAIIHLHNESKNGNTQAKKKLDELLNSNEEIGVITREIIRELE